MSTIVHCDPTLPFGERVRQVAASALAFGKLSEDSLLPRYRALIACGYREDLSHVRTSCGIFVRACMHWAGRPAPTPGSIRVGGALVGHPSWTDLATDDAAYRPA